MSEASWPTRPRKVPNIFITWLAVPSTIVMVGFGLLMFYVPGLIALLLLSDSGLASLGLGLSAITALAIYLLIRFTTRRRRRLFMDIQRERDTFAVAVANLLEAGHQPPPYSLYLRPFFTDGHLTADEGTGRILAIDPTEMAEIGQTRDTERAMANALEEHAPLISLGRPSDRFGAGRIETDDENWKALFEKLIAQAERVIMVPIGQPATMEEVRTIAATPELLAKTVFVRPANRRKAEFNFTPDESVDSIKDMWEWTREQLSDVLPTFPEFGHSPRLITFDEYGESSEYRGNGMASVQLPSGVRTFMTEGRQAIADGWLATALLFVSMLAVMPALMVPIGYYAQMFAGDVPDATAEDMRRIAMFANFLAVWPLALIAYKFVTGDLPTRLFWPCVLLIVTFLVASVSISYIWDQTMAYIDIPELSDEDWAELNRLVQSFETVLLAAVVSKLAVFLWLSTTLITGNALRWQHLLIILGSVALLSFVLLVSEGMASMIVSYGASALVLLFAGVVPVWERATTAQRLYCILTLLGCFAASGLALALLGNAAIEVLTASQEAPTSALPLILALLPAAVPLIGYGYLARVMTGQGRAGDWADPLPKFEIEDDYELPDHHV